MHYGRHPCPGAGCPARGRAALPPSRAHSPTLVQGPLPQSPQPSAHCPARRAPGRSFLLCSLFAARCPPSPSPARPRRRQRAPRGGGGDRRGRDGRLCSRRRGLSRADTARDAAARRSSAAWLRASPRLCGTGREGGAAGVGLRRLESPQGYRSATWKLRATAGPPKPQPGLPERRPCSCCRDARTLHRPAATCSGPRGEDTMRSALALSALLLLLLLSNGEGQPTSDRSPTTTGTLTPSAKPSTNIDPRGTTLNPGNQSISARSHNPIVTSAPVQQRTNEKDEKLVTSNPPTSTDGSKESKNSAMTTSQPTSTAKSETTTGQNEIKDAGKSEDNSSHNVSTNSVTPKEATQVTSQPPALVDTSETTPAPSLSTSSNPHQSTGSHVSPEHQGSSSEEQNTTATSMEASSTFISQGIPTILTPSTTLERNGQNSSEIPAFTGTSASTTPQPRGTSSGPVSTPPVRGPVSLSTESASTAPQGSNKSPTRALGNKRCETPQRPDEKMLVLNLTKTALCCETPQRPDEKMLVLNLTKTALCAEDPPDDKLVTVLCQAAKVTFNPAQDQCHIRLAPVPESQAVIVKEITVQTILLPRDVYELLKIKWDDLKEAGISNMQFGDQGPPEEAEDRFSMPLIITIVCMASFLLLVAALYGCCHQRLSQRKDQQRLTEELQTVENGYHDNPTLEVMETSSEMQEKKVVNLNGELGDSWIVPLDNLSKDDLDEEEDTHL
ncbi:podocalyxin [Tamandua tetradactyla]|uniref:podocalyxin n=1 Tax=Tamandua tetradactyla TaxID=48850 RepID=UPI004053E0BF